MKVHESMVEVVRVLSKQHAAYGLAALAMMLATIAAIAIAGHSGLGMMT